MNSTEKLINLVQQQPCLYDCRNRAFKNSLKKDMLWEEIAKELNESCDAIKTKWKNLKDGYTKYKKNTKGTTGRKKTYYNWVWGPYLTFLDQRSTVSNVVGPQYENVKTEHDPQLLAISPSLNDTPVAIDPLYESLSSPPPYRLPLHSSRKRSSDDQDDFMDKVLNCLNNKEKKDSVDLLFASYAKTLKKLKPRTQASLKLKLAQIFAEAEIEDLQLENVVSVMSPAYSE